MPSWPSFRLHSCSSAALVVLAAAFAPAAVAQPVSWADALDTSSRLVVRFREPAAAAKSTTSIGREQAALALSRRALLPLAHVRLAGAGRDHVLSMPQEFDAAQARAVARRLATDRDVESVSIDWRVWPAQAGPALPDDPQAAAQWPIAAPALGAFGPGSARFVPAWQLATGRNVTVAIIDTGIVPHTDLAGRIVGGYDFIDDPAVAADGNRRDADFTDPGDGCLSGSAGCPVGGRASSWHGTMVAGLIGAIRGNGRAVTGAAPDAALLVVRALGRSGGWSSDIADAIRWSAGLPVAGVPTNLRPARVLNLSLGTRSSVSSCEPTMADAVRLARASGSVIVAAAGNEGASGTYAGGMGMPANCDGVIAVAAHNRAGDLATYSNWSSRVTLTAPGGGCGRTDPGCTYGESATTTGNAGSITAGAESVTGFNGTSAAAPHVSAAAALVLEAAPTLAPDGVASLLVSSAAAPPAGTWCVLNPTRCGAGMLDALESVRRASGTPPPAVAIEARARDWEPAGGTATLRAVGTAASGRPLQYRWRQVAGTTAVVRPSADGAALAVDVPMLRSDLVFEVTATDDLGLAAHAQTSFRSNRPPVLDLPAGRIAAVGERVSIPVAATDADGDPVTVALLSGPSGARYDARTAMVSWTSGPAGRYEIELMASDGLADSVAVGRLAVTVAATGLQAPAPAMATVPSPSAAFPAPPAAPVQSAALVIEDIGPQTRIDVGAGRSLSLTLSSRDTPAERLSFRLRGGPAGMSIDEASGLLSWSPLGPSGVFEVEIDVTRIMVSASSGSAGIASTSTVSFKVAYEPDPGGPSASASPLSGKGGGGAVGLGGLLLLAAALAAPRRAARPSAFSQTGRRAAANPARGPGPPRTRPPARPRAHRPAPPARGRADCCAATDVPPPRATAWIDRAA